MQQKVVDILPEYTICPCHRHTLETWDHLKQCPLFQDDVHLATLKPEDTIAQHAGWGPATPPANEIRRLMRRGGGAEPLEIYPVLADNAPTQVLQ